MNKRQLLYLPVILIISVSCKSGNRPIISTVKADTTDVWVPDNNDGTYKNPVIYADYSDPDVIRRGDDYYLISSSFNCVPGIPILHSGDLVNWKIVGHVMNRLQPDDYFSIPRHGQGVWAPSLRYHDGEYYIYYGDPDFGIYMTKAENPAGPWTDPLLVKKAKGWIDPCPFWDENGNAYLVHAWAGSRSGIKSILTINRMTSDGSRLLDDGVMIFDGHDGNSTVEGPKMYKRNGYYYIFAPAGGVEFGWQIVLRSKNIYGPYEVKKVLHQGNTDINGPHQGAWVETKTGESWFIHFQDKEAYGRVVLLEPMSWTNDWPSIGIDKNKDGIGEPVSKYRKPSVGKIFPIEVPQTSDEFNSPELGLQWQWHANPDARWGFPTGNLGYFRLNALPVPDTLINFWNLPELLLQKFPAPAFKVTCKIVQYLKHENDKAGLIIMGSDYAYIAVTKKKAQLLIEQGICLNADKNSPENRQETQVPDSSVIYFRCVVSDSAVCEFYYSLDGKNFVLFGSAFTAKPGRWIGAKNGLFCTGNTKTNDVGYIDVDWFRIEKL